MFAITQSWVLAICTLSAVLWLWRRASSLPLPPGPRALPFVGNVLQVPRKRVADTLSAWRKTYGDIIYFHILGREFVVLNSSRIVNELFDQRGARYSDRPHSVMGGDLLRKRKAVLFHPYNDRWKKHRRLLHAALNAQHASVYWHIQEEEACRLTTALLKDADNYVLHLRRHAGAVTLRTAYGYHITPAGEDPLVNLADELARVTSLATMPGRWAVDSIPWLRYLPSWMPGAGFKRWASEARKIVDAFASTPYKEARAAMGKGVRSFVSDTIELLESETGQPLTAEDDDLVMWTAAAIYSGATDTSVSLNQAFLMYMVAFPEVQAKAQAELDAVIGTERFATMQDRLQLPFIDALTKEIHRYRPITPLIPHSTVVDDEYAGYRIPKGSWIMANILTTLHDPEVFPQPERFWPERYLEGGCTLDPREYTFGFGRRRCPGIYFAEATFFLTIVHILGALRISPPINEKGEKELPSMMFTDGHITHPLPFRCVVEPRSKTLVDLLLGMGEKAQSG